MKSTRHSWVPSTHVGTGSIQLIQPVDGPSMMTSGLTTIPETYLYGIQSDPGYLFLPTLIIWQFTFIPKIDPPTTKAVDRAADRAIRLLNPLPADPKFQLSLKILSISFLFEVGRLNLNAKLWRVGWSVPWDCQLGPSSYIVELFGSRVSKNIL